MKSIDKIGNILNRMAVDLAVKDEPMFEAENRAKVKLHSLLISKLPEKKPLVLEKEYSTPRELLPQEQEIKLNTNHQVIGFNQAVDDMRKSIDGLFNEV